MANELDEAALSAIEAPERIWVDRLRGETEEGEWFITTDTDCEGEEGWTQYVRADTVESLRAELAEKERYRLALESLTPQGSEYVNDPDACVAVVRSYRRTQHERIIKLTKENNALRANQATVVQDAFKFLEDANETFHVKWSFLTKRYLITIPNLDQEFSGKTLTEAIEAARHTEDKGKHSLHCGAPDQNEDCPVCMDTEDKTNE